MGRPSNRNSKGNKKLRVRLYARDNGICQLCMEPVSFEEFTIDHVIPRAKGGSNNIDNLQIAHDKCNEGKSDTYYPPTEDPLAVLLGKWQPHRVLGGDNGKEEVF